MAIWITNEDWISKNTGKIQVIDKFGGAGWLEKPKGKAKYKDPYNRMDIPSTRPTCKGEEDLCRILKNWMNLKRDQECRVEDMDALFNGDFSQIKSLPATNSGASFVVMLGVKDEKYQDVYTKFTGRTWWDNNNKKFTEALNGDWTKFNADYQNSLEFKVYGDEGLIAPTTPKSTMAPSNVFEQESDVEDLPF